jgi:hypothetical protein
MSIDLELLQCLNRRDARGFTQRLTCANSMELRGIPFELFSKKALETDQFEIFKNLYAAVGGLGLNRAHTYTGGFPTIIRILESLPNYKKYIKYILQVTKMDFGSLIKLLTHPKFLPNLIQQANLYFDKFFDMAPEEINRNRKKITDLVYFSINNGLEFTIFMMEKMKSLFPEVLTGFEPRSDLKEKKT